MKSLRKYPHSQLMTVKEFSGVRLIMYIVDDLTDEELLDQFTYYFRKQDFEYVAVLAAELRLRGLYHLAQL
jgi:hypothetical protein